MDRKTSRLVEALEPFAVIEDAFGPEHRDDGVVWFGSRGHVVRVSHLRNAAAAFREAWSEERAKIEETVLDGKRPEVEEHPGLADFCGYRVHLYHAVCRYASALQKPDYRERRMAGDYLDNILDTVIRAEAAKLAGPGPIRRAWHRLVKWFDAMSEPKLVDDPRLP